MRPAFSRVKYRLLLYLRAICSCHLFGVGVGCVSSLYLFRRLSQLLNLGGESVNVILFRTGQIRKQRPYVFRSGLIRGILVIAPGFRLHRQYKAQNLAWGDEWLQPQRSTLYESRFHEEIRIFSSRRRHGIQTQAGRL